MRVSEAKGARGWGAGGYPRREPGGGGRGDIPGKLDFALTYSQAFFAFVWLAFVG
jgi:hypothetical protein